ncbi:prolyl oligopeptidase family serine peptidase [Polymorphobacter fuscus]|nr:prolyl oligopeptidase family serine peptidase [Polymorphobacter fuscus]NJC07921.1 dipeptidyl-peptidase-4 [Polymorphobacter fuscus]
MGAFLMVLGLAVPGVAAQPAKAPVAGTTLSIDALYQPQSIIGTPPEGYSWAADGSRVLFLWNDEGRRFRDIWVHAVAGGTTSRLTRAADSAGDAEAIGIAEVVDLGGGRLAYVLAGGLYLRGSDGTVTRIEPGLPSVRQLALSPDGRTLAFVSDMPGIDGGTARGGVLHVRDAGATAATAARRLAGGDDARVYVKDFQWAHDGRTIAFDEADDRLMPERDIFYYADGKLQNNRVARAFPGDETTRDRIGTVDLASGAVRFHAPADPRDLVWNYGLSRDGRRLFINASDLEAKTHRITVHDVASGERQPFYSWHDPLHVRPDWQVEWAPGDDGLIILTDRDGYFQLHHQKTANSRPRRLTDGRWEVASFTVDADHGQIYFLSNAAHLAERQIYRVPAGGGAVTRVSPATPGTHVPVYAPQFGHAASFFSNDSTPPELVLVDLARGGPAVAVTRSPRPEFQAQRWADVRYMTFPSHVDGTPLVARVSLPANYDPAKRYPLIVGSVYSDVVRNQWGGRRAHPTWGLDQYLVGQGYILLNVNVRGSWGQGRVQREGQHHSYGETDINDLESGVRHLVAKGYVDPKRVGIWGSSYGGLMTLMSLAKKPGVYAAGIAGAPASNVWHAYPSEMWIMGPPTGADMPGRYAAQSPLYQSRAIVDPLMIIHGTRDPVVLYSDTAAFSQRLIAGEQPFELVTLPGGNHAWASDNLAQTRFAFKKMTAFFDSHLKPEPKP